MQRECSEGCRKDDSQEIQGETWKTEGTLMIKQNEGAEWKRETMKEVVVKNEKREELKGVQTGKESKQAGQKWKQ